MRENARFESRSSHQLRVPIRPRAWGGKQPQEAESWVVTLEIRTADLSICSRLIPILWDYGWLLLLAPRAQVNVPDKARHFQLRWWMCLHLVSLFSPHRAQTDDKMEILLRRTACMIRWRIRQGRRRSFDRPLTVDPPSIHGHES
jgi:hypothetical protein